MSNTGPRAKIPHEITSLQPHFKVVVDAIASLISLEFSATLSPHLLSLMRNYLNVSSLHFTFTNMNHNRGLHIPNVDDTDLPLISLVSTLKYFFRYLQITAQRDGDLDNLLRTEFHFFAAFTCASMLANKIIYERILPECGDIYDVFDIIYKNIIKEMRSIVLEPPSNNDWWNDNSSDCLRLIEIISEYTPLEESAIEGLDVIIENLDGHDQVDFKKLVYKLKILNNFKHYSDDSDISDEESFYQDEGHDDYSFESFEDEPENVDDYEVYYQASPASNSCSSSGSDSYEGEVRPERTSYRVIHNLSKHEQAFLKTLDYRASLTFSIIEAEQLLHHAKQFVRNPANVDSFISRLETFGESTLLRASPAILPDYSRIRSTSPKEDNRFTVAKTPLRKFSY